MDYDKFICIMSGNGQQLSRDDFVTYDDVYNIWYAFMNKAIKKYPDPFLSCIKWMEEFEEDSAFNYYNNDDLISSVHFGFVSLWQLRQLKAYGRAACFDGTHNVFE
ncbi:hypothetical protein EC968_007567 [Mortierella alpina]|nr:hypothetical protein EC968_007567 [Mortierella alpina]